MKGSVKIRSVEALLHMNAKRLYGRYKQTKRRFYQIDKHIEFLFHNNLLNDEIFIKLVKMKVLLDIECQKLTMFRMVKIRQIDANPKTKTGLDIINAQMKEIIDNNMHVRFPSFYTSYFFRNNEYYLNLIKTIDIKKPI